MLAASTGPHQLHLPVNKNTVTLIHKNATKMYTFIFCVKVAGNYRQTSINGHLLLATDDTLLMHKDMRDCTLSLSQTDLM